MNILCVFARWPHCGVLRNEEEARESRRVSVKLSLASARPIVACPASVNCALPEFCTPLPSCDSQFPACCDSMLIGIQIGPLCILADTALLALRGYPRKVDMPASDLKFLFEVLDEDDDGGMPRQT